LNHPDCIANPYAESQCQKINISHERSDFKFL
jgi:hypothetical protein